jgi:large subunit ribosomal protein L21
LLPASDACAIIAAPHARRAGSSAIHFTKQGFMSYAVIKTGGKQYRVTVGEKLDVEKLDALGAGDAVTFSDVLAAGEGESFRVGAPYLSGASVAATVVKQFKAPKVINFKFRRRKGYHRKRGHRQNLTRIEITSINA